MAGDDDPAGERYHFRAGDSPTSMAVIEAVAFVTARDPLELERLGRIVDPDALDRLVESAEGASVSFGMEGLTVRVHGDGDIVIEDPSWPRSSDADLGGSSVLLLDGPGTDGACAARPRPAGPAATNLLAVSFTPPDSGRLDGWFADGRGPANAAVIGVGEFARSSAGTASTPADPTGPVAVDVVPDPADLEAVETRIGEWLGAWEGLGDRTLVCFDSVTALLDAVGSARAVEFLRGVTARTRSAAATAHFHLDADRYDDLVGTAPELFDSVLTVDEEGEWVVEPGVER